MSAKHRLKVVAGANGAPWCVLGAETTARGPDVAWTGPWEAFDGLEVAGKLLGESAIFCAELTARWGCLVVCTPAFLVHARSLGQDLASSGPPSGFFVEVLA